MRGANPIGELPRRLSISADGRRLYATDFAHGTVWALDTSDNSVAAIVPVCAHPAAVALSPDGDFLYVTDSRDGTLTVVSTSTVPRATRAPCTVPDSSSPAAPAHRPWDGLAEL